MSADTTRVTVSRFFEYANRLAAGELAWSDVEDLLTPDFRAHLSGGQAMDREMFGSVVAALDSGFTGATAAVEDVIAEGDRVAARVTWRGTHNGTLLGYPPTSRAITVPGCFIFRVAEHRIAELWVALDLLGPLRQLGVVQAQGPGAA